MRYMIRSIYFQMLAEKAFARERREARLAALHHLRWELCRVLDDLITLEDKGESLETDHLEKR